MADTRITEDDFGKFQEFFYRKTGIRFENTKRYFVDKRLVDRMGATDSDSFRDYFTMLRFEAAGTELQTLINVMTINETYFFREEYQFLCLVNSILPEIIARRQHDGPIRIWVVPSSTGEEPYSIAICLLERWLAINDWDVEIISSDIDTNVLNHARAGLYSARSTQHVPEAYMRKYFRRTPEGFQLTDNLRGAVEFTRVNLQERTDVWSYSNFDVIFCRNMLIYFDDVSRKQAVQTLFDALRPGGFLLLGHSESMSRISALYKVRKFREAIVYQKAGGGWDEAHTLSG
jgi:chemotaxis protein methyltransferase CheR